MCALNFHCLRLLRLNSDVLKPDVSILCLNRFLSPRDVRDSLQLLWPVAASQYTLNSKRTV